MYGHCSRLSFSFHGFFGCNFVYECAICCGCLVWLGINVICAQLVLCSEVL